MLWFIFTQQMYTFNMFSFGLEIGNQPMVNDLNK